MFKSFSKLIRGNMLKTFSSDFKYNKILMMFSTDENNSSNKGNVKNINIDSKVDKSNKLKDNSIKKKKDDKADKIPNEMEIKKDKNENNKKINVKNNAKEENLVNNDQDHTNKNKDKSITSKVVESKGKKGNKNDNENNKKEIIDNKKDDVDNANNNLSTDQNIIENEKETVEDEEVSKTKTEVTTELLCKLIGSKHYDYNENIKLDKLTIVRCYNENDVNLGDRTLQDILKEAEILKKDVILRNEKSNPPVVKVMRYKIELAKRLLKKLSKDKKLNITEAKQNKIVYVGLNTDLNDIQIKVKKWRLLLNHFSHLTVKIICSLEDKEQVIQATEQLNKIADMLGDVGRISISPRKNIEAKNQLAEIKEDETKLINVLTNEEEQNLAQEAKDLLQDLEDKNIDLSAKNFVEMELESMLIDTSGINYELLLSNIHMEDILSGLENKKFFKKSDSYTQPKEDETKEKKRFNEKQKKTVKEEIKALEKDLLKELDLSKRLYKKKKLEANYIQYQDIKTSILFRSIILKEVSIMKTKLAENPNEYD